MLPLAEALNQPRQPPRQLRVAPSRRSSLSDQEVLKVVDEVLNWVVLEAAFAKGHPGASNEGDRTVGSTYINNLQAPASSLFLTQEQHRSTEVVNHESITIEHSTNSQQAKKRVALYFPFYHLQHMLNQQYQDAPISGHQQTLQDKLPQY